MKFTLVAISLLALTASIDAEAQKPSKEQLKVNVYVEMLNKWSPFMSKGWKTYTKWADPKSPPTCKEKGIRPPGGLGTSAPKIFADLKKALKKKPKLAVDAQAMAMAEALEEIREPVTEAGTYFRSAYRKDDCKRGKELHVALVAAWTKYFEAEPAVRAFVTEFNDKRAIAGLAKTKKKYGKKNRYHYEKLILDGKKLIRTIDLATQKRDMNVAAIEEGLASFRATRESALAIIAKANKRDASVLYQGGYKQFAERGGSQLVGAVEQMLKTYGKRNEPRFREDRLKRDIKSTFDSYNRMIELANKVRFSKKIK